MNTLPEQMRKIINLLESKSADLYHGTSLEGAEGILSSDHLEVNQWGAHDHPSNVYPETVKGSDEAASLTRNFETAKQYSENYGSGAVFVFDQELLVRDFGRRLRPVNTQYGNRSWGKEEELMYDGIPNVEQYIKEIYVFVEDPSELDEYEELQNSPLVTIVPGDVPATTRMLKHQLGKESPQ